MTSLRLNLWICVSCQVSCVTSTSAALDASKRNNLASTLPKLPEYMEYHFVGKKLVLVDAAAGVVVDFTPNVLP